MYELNIVLAFFAVFVVCAFLAVRENESALDLLSNWAASRSWGLKCAKAEYKNRLEKLEDAMQ
jgi:hypothetical protein